MFSVFAKHHSNNPDYRPAQGWDHKYKYHFNTRKSKVKQEML